MDRIRKKLMDSEYLPKILVFVTALSSLLVTVISIFMQFSDYSLFVQKKDRPELSSRIEVAANELKDLGIELNLIQVELENRITIVEELQAKAKDAETMLSLSSEQVEAIRKTLSTEIADSKLRDTVSSIALNLVFMIAGGFLSYYIALFLGKRKRKSRAISTPPI